MIILLTAVLILVSESICHADALPIGASADLINNTLEAYSYIASYRPLVQALVSFIVTVLMLNLYAKMGILLPLCGVVNKFWVRYRSQCSVMIFTLKAAFALTVIETFFADDLSDEQWKLIDNSWVILQMWMVVFSPYFFSLVSTMLTELTETRGTRLGPFGPTVNTFGPTGDTFSPTVNTFGPTVNTFGSTGNTFSPPGNIFSNNNGASSNERSPLLPSVRPTEPIRTVVVDSF
ncbi:hypothetical protein BGX20_006456 [Mortierella sp. AD010]|nr:hypothetical protein BGX20_006456 [Mortierella sp. AD010]